MARDGRIHAETSQFPLEQAMDVYEKLKAGPGCTRARRLGAPVRVRGGCGAASADLW